MKLSAKHGLYTGRRITLFASMVCISLAVTACKEDNTAIEKVNAITVEQSELSTAATDVVASVEKVAVKTETNADKIAKEMAQKASYAKEYAERLASSDADPSADTPTTAEKGTKHIRISNVYVVDGDTIHGTDNASGAKIKVRMTGIDAPEKGQQLSKESADELRNCIGSEQTAMLVVQSNNEKDKYGRILARVESQGVNCNQQQVEKGMAWFYEDFADKITNEDNRIYNEAHDYAQDNALGLWQLPLDTKKPWDYRAENK